MRVAIVIGTRPQIIKSAPIVHAAQRRSEIELSIVHTGQHYDFKMSREFFNELELPDPVINLGVGSGPHGWQTGTMLIGLEKAFIDLKPDVVLVPGDTNSTLAGGLAAAKMHIPVAHVESGARSFDREMPEEMNRIVVDHVSDTLFSVSRRCVENLKREGINEKNIDLVGDTMYESIQAHIEDIRGKTVCKEYGFEYKQFGVVTLHRAENTDDETRLRNIIESLNSLKVNLVFPCHPRTRAKLSELNLLSSLRVGFRIVEPVPYFKMLSLVDEAGLVFTDSGGVQKEAFWLDTPCITMRDTTEWVETIEANANVLVGSDQDKLRMEAIKKFNQKNKAHQGDAGGLLIPKASESILDRIILNY